MVFRAVEMMTIQMEFLTKEIVEKTMVTIRMKKKKKIVKKDPSIPYDRYFP